MNRLTKLRYLVVLLLAAFLLWTVFWVGLFSMGVATFMTATLLFSLNQRWSDWMSLIIFGFGVAASLFYIGRGCVFSGSCLESVGRRLAYAEGISEALFLLLSVLSMSLVACVLWNFSNSKKLR